MTPDFDPLDHPILFSSPRRTTPHSTWLQHVPFAMLLVDLLRPQVIVELGTYFGDSYCAFCQAVETLRLPTKCYGVDTWRGDAHVGFYGDDVLADLRAHHDPLYGNFSQLIRSTFDEAASHFGDETIDLLHLDGCHTYEEVKSDFETWLPKVSARGVVIIHDVFVRERDFGAWRFWDEIKNEYPSLDFFHGYGLGVVAVGRDPAPEVRQLLNVRNGRLEALRTFLFKLGSAIEKDAQLNGANAELARLRARESEFDAAQAVHQRLDASRLMKVVRGYWHVRHSVRELMPRQNRSANGLQS